MSRQDTVNKYIDEFLQGRGPEACERFRSKDLNKQYSSIMQWRRKVRIQESTPRSTREITDMLKKVGQMIVNAPEFAEDDASAVSHELEVLRQTVGVTLEKRREAQIQALEEESRRIASRLEQLRQNN